MYRLILLTALNCMVINAISQVTLSADGTTDTYQLINSVLAPNYNAIEVPDCGHIAFGPHIDQVYDDDLKKYVFRFHIHTAYDSDRCINYDRQRCEIKTYDQSPDHLKGTLGETVTYKWLFKLEDAFAASSSFTHLHQLKAVGGSEESMPLITLTARKGTPDQLELRYAEALSQTSIYKTSLEPFKGSWVEATEVITYDEDGTYSIIIKTLNNEEILFEYSSKAIRTWKTDASFIRPKWGIYRSLNDSDNLRDEIIHFADFRIIESGGTPVTNQHNHEEVIIYPNPCKGHFTLSNTLGKDILISSLNGEIIYTKNKLTQNTLELNKLPPGVYIIKLSTHKDIYSRKIIVNP